MATFKTSKARENILGRIRKGLSQEKLPMPFPEAEKESVSNVFAATQQSAEESFAENFIRLGGKFIFCDNEQEMLEHVCTLYESNGWHQLLCADNRILKLFTNNKIDIVESADTGAEHANACITGCEYLIGRTGSAILSSHQDRGRVSSVFYPVHIIVAYASQVVPDIQDGVNLMKKKYGNELPSMINLNTGPSRTADIEKTLVVGVHGPGEVYCFFVNA